MGSNILVIFGAVIRSLTSSLSIVLAVIIAAALIFVVSFFVLYRVTPFSTAEQLSLISVKFKWYDFFRWKMVDFKRRGGKAKIFPEFGFTVFVGRQGSGKTISMVNYLYETKKHYPDCVIVSNFKCALSDLQMTDWRDFFNIRNGENGVVFAIDEIHSEYDSSKWRDFPESLLSEISQQRKQKIKIIASSQAFKRIAKPMREQTYSVVECRTRFGRLTSCKEYDAFEYDLLDTIYAIGSKIKPYRSFSFIQSDNLRSCYDTFEKIERLARSEFIPRGDRGNDIDSI